MEPAEGWLPVNVYPDEVYEEPGAKGKVQLGSVYTFAVDVESKFQDWIEPGTVTWRAVMGEVPVLVIVIETIPPPFHVELSAKEIPDLQLPLVPLEEEEDEEGCVEVLVLVEGGTTAPEELLVEVEVEVAVDATEDEDEDEELAWEEEELAWVEELELELEDPEVHPLVEHSQVAALLHEGEPPPPQGTWR
jgi:hypothetical protein